MAHTDLDDPAWPNHDSNDWIEILNPTGQEVILGTGWFLSDDAADLKKWAIPADTAVAAGGRVVFDEIHGFHVSPTAGFGLDKAGEQLFLSHLPHGSPGRVVDCLRFKGQENAASLSRAPEDGPYWQAGIPMLGPARGLRGLSKTSLWPDSG